jgi:plastocyanin
MMRLEVTSVCICLLLISPIILQNVSAKLPVVGSNQPVKLHQQETIASKKIIIPDGAADQNLEFYYQPREVTIPNDTSVTWVNQDSALHTATADNGSFDTGIIPIDANATVIITGSGKLDYHCTIHPWMQGTITVVSSSGYSSEQLHHPGPLGNSATLTPYLLTIHKTLKLLPRSLSTDYGTEPEHKNDWITVNHDIFGTRSSNQTIIGKDNVKKLQFKWILLNKSPIEDPPIIIGDRGYVQDNGGNIVAFDSNTGHTLWKIHQGIGQYFHGLTYDHGVLFSETGYNSTVIAVNPTNGGIIWQSPVLGPSKAGYGVATPPIVWKDYVVVGSAGGDFPHDQSWQKGVVLGNITALNRTNGDIIWNFRTTTGEWVSPGKSPPNGGATAWSGGSFDPQSKILYMPLGNPAPDYNASTRPINT